MAIFNSLGSNYDFSYIKRSLTTFGSKKDSDKLASLLDHRYGGNTILLYKGREALSIALKLIELPDDAEIAINGFTCVAVFNAIRFVGYEPICIDLQETGGLNFTPEDLEKKVRSNKKIKVVVVQNTLGYPCDIKNIEAICKKNDLILIEDLAHCVGTKYEDGREAGTVGDFVVLSFSQDKIIDAVSGGALIIRNKKYENVFIEKSFKTRSRIKDRLYPHLTYKIRKLYPFGFGKPYHFLLKRLNLLSDIMNNSLYKSYSLPNWNAAMALFEFKNLNKQLVHRKRISNIYASQLPDTSFMFDRKKTEETIKLSSNLRFPLFLENRATLIKKAKTHGLYIEDIWYKDVAPECPNAVKDSKIILNLPTHINVSEENAKMICDIINTWIQK